MTAPLPLIRKFQALTNRVDEALGQTALSEGTKVPRYSFDPLDILPLFERWTTIRAELIATEPELADLPECVPPMPIVTEIAPGMYSPERIDRTPIERMRNHMRDAWDILNHPSRQIPQVSIYREGIFVAGQPFDAMIAVTSILRVATKSITIVDGYISEHTLSLLRVKADLVAARILTQKQSANATLVTHAKAFIAQYAAGPPLELRTTSSFHDRFIVIDDTEYYHFGASIKDAAKKSVFMFSRIEEPVVLAALKAEIAKQWGAASVVPL